MKAAAPADSLVTPSVDTVIRGLELAHNNVEVRISAIRNTVLALQEAASHTRTPRLDWASLMDGILSMLPEEEDMSDAVDRAVGFLLRTETPEAPLASDIEPHILDSIIRVTSGEDTSEASVDAGQAYLCELHVKHGKAFAPAIASYLRAVQRHAATRTPQTPTARPRSEARKRDRLTKAAHAA